jgi:6-phosphogluconolactonase
MDFLRIRYSFLKILLMKLITGIVFLTLMTFMFSCRKDGSMTATSNDPSQRMNPRTGMVYVNGNTTGTNTILSYEQQPNGMLVYATSTNSGGAGTSTGLGSQGAIALNSNHSMLFAVNAGSNSVSSFSVSSSGALTLVSTVSSMGVMPVSLTVYQDYLYVVNSGSDNISGYMIGANGMLTPITGSVQPLSGTGTMPAQISFSATGQKLFVTEKATNKITMYTVSSGVASAATSVASAGMTPFGFDFSGNYLIVSEAFGGTPNASTVSSYDGNNNAALVSGPVGAGQTAACWVEITADGEYAFVTNTGSNTISIFEISSGGIVTVEDGDAATTGMGPIDITLSGNGMYLYNINGGSHTISEFRNVNDTKLQSIGTINGLPAGASGIVAY